MARTVQAQHPSTVALCNSFGHFWTVFVLFNSTCLTSKLVLEHISKALADSSDIPGLEMITVDILEIEKILNTKIKLLIDFQISRKLYMDSKEKKKKKKILSQVIIQEINFPFFQTKVEKQVNVCR